MAAKKGAVQTVKNHFVAFLGEFAGTFLFLFVAFTATQSALQPEYSIPGFTGLTLQQVVFIPLAFGLSLVVNVWMFFRISGGLFNPAVTLALCLVGVVPWLRGIFLLVAQIIGGLAATAATRGLLPGNKILFTVALSNGTSVAQGLFLETFLTTELVFTILMLAAEKTKATFIAPIGIGLSLFAAMLAGVSWTGASLNPSRAFGPAALNGSFGGSHWIYWLGPILGALLAVLLYKVFKLLDYEEVNGDQDKFKDEEGTEEQDTGNDSNGESRSRKRQSSSSKNGTADVSSRQESRGHAPQRDNRDNRANNGSQRENGHANRRSTVRRSQDSAPQYRTSAEPPPPPQFRRSGEQYVQDPYAQDRVLQPGYPLRAAYPVGNRTGHELSHVNRRNGRL